MLSEDDDYYELKRLHIDLGLRSYPILIGENLLAAASRHLQPFLTGRRCLIVSDKNVAPHYLAALAENLRTLGQEVFTHVRPPGEGQKCFAVLEDVLAAALKANIGRDDCLIALGGGVIGDLTGFAASILKRGCGFIQIPTTLLAQVDSAVGGKTAINVPEGKNLIGSFYQPRCVLADLGALKTLPEREIKAGYAEIVKYGLLGDADFFAWLENNGEHVLALKAEAASYAVSASCAAKADIVAQDEREHGVRALLNLGHTFAHALEAHCGYDGRLLHGEAVSAGMLMAYDFAAFCEMAPAGDAARVREHLTALDMPIFAGLPDALRPSPEQFLTYMMQDKKNKAGALTLILPRRIGECTIERASDQTQLLAFLASYER